MTPTCYMRRWVKDTARLRTDLIECTSNDDRGWLRMWPIERQNKHGEDDDLENDKKPFENHLVQICRTHHVIR